MDNVAEYTVGFGKTGDGARAPELWQDGKIAELINYLSGDLRAEAALFKHIYEHGFVRNGHVGVDRLDLTGIQKYQELV